MPKSVTRVNKDGVKFISNVDQASYTITELERAAFRDVAKVIKRDMKKRVPVHKGVLKSNIGTWVRKGINNPRLQLGIYKPSVSKKKGKTPAYHAHLLEFGTVNMRPIAYLKPSTYENIQLIREIQSKYLSYIESVETTLKYINEEEEIT